MKKAVAALMLAVSIYLLHYYGFVQPIIVTAVPEFFHVLKDVNQGVGEFPYFIYTFGTALLSISIIFLSFGLFWAGLELAFSKSRDFSMVLSRTSVFFIAVGAGLLFMGQFASAFSFLLQLDFFNMLVGALFTLASLEFTLTLLRYLSTSADSFTFSIKFSKA